MSGSAQCPHPGFRFNVNVFNIEGDTIKYADITGHCEACGKSVLWRGPYPVGVNPNGPSTDIDRKELRAPLVMEGEDVDETKPRPGFSVTGV